MLRVVALLLLTASPALPQGWETFSHDMGSGAAVCPVDDPETGRFFCFAVACLPEGGPPLIRVAVPATGETGGETGDSPARAPLSVHVDGKVVAMLFLERLPGEDPADYGIPVEPARDAALLEALKSGSRSTLIFGTGPGAIVQPATLTGSRAALDQVPVLCGGVPLSSAMPDG
jgi:hypothetical protein